MSGTKKLLLGIVVIAAILLYSSVFVVREGQTAIRFMFGEIVQSDYQPGLHFKMPLVNTIQKFDGRLQTLDTDPERFLTSEKKNLSVDSYVKWRINNAQQFYTNVRGDVFIANQRLDQFLKDGLRNEFGKRTLTEAVSGDRTQIMQILSSLVNEKAQQIGVEVVDVRIKRIDLPEEVSDSVFARMRAERERVA
ncbi:MAG: protease modulator HflC, partial [Candidatus Competibacteraceae bacterium]|nr:protease modulator HflC [Candidatus Competibacteraceae bacterium]